MFVQTKGAKMSFMRDDFNAEGKDRVDLMQINCCILSKYMHIIKQQWSRSYETKVHLENSCSMIDSVTLLHYRDASSKINLTSRTHISVTQIALISKCEIIVADKH